MQTKFSKIFETRWSDFDANMHMRHTVYNDCAAQLRLDLLVQNGFDMKTLSKIGLGPVLLREETKFLREVNIGENLTVDVEIIGLSKSGDRWNMLHHIYKNETTLAAIITVEGAWIDMRLRKIATPPKELNDKFLDNYRSDNFEWIERKAK
ncbi:MAG: thioesterase family protein [Flavobacteriales bacterium]|nr:thioesterase family protein [Flavobacteriales bacterium]